MAVTIDWATFTITVPRADLTLIQSTPTEIRELNLNTFREELKAIEATPEGMGFPKTLDHYTAVQVGGIELAHVMILLAPYTVTFEDGQYAVNLSRANSNVGDRVNVNQVSVRSANSAGLVQTKEIEFTAFENGITIDTANGVPGTLYPTGTPYRPVNNLLDAQIIARYRGFLKLYVRSNLTIEATDNISNYTLVGDGSSLNTSKTTITLTDGCLTANTEFEQCAVVGRQGGECYYRKCRILNITNSHCVFDGCSMSGPVQLSNAGWTTNHVTDLKDCYTGKDWYVLDYNASPIKQVYTNFSGRIKITNMTNASGQLILRCDAAKVWIDASCTAGSIILDGIGSVTNESGGAAVDISGFTEGSMAIYGKTVYIDTDSGVAGTAFPIGTFDHPVNNIADALYIAHDKFCNILHLHSSLTVPAGTDVSEFVVEAHGTFDFTLTLEEGCLTEETVFRNVKITGHLGGRATFTNCLLENLSHIAGTMHECIFNGNIVLGDGMTTPMLHMNGTRSHTQTPPVINIGTTMVNATNSFGMFVLVNKSSASEFNMHAGYGYIIVDSSCVAGSIYLAGVGTVIDNSGPNCDVINQMNMGGSGGTGDASWSQDVPNGYTAPQAGWTLSDIHTMVGSFQSQLEQLLSRSYQAGSVALPTAVEGGETITFYTQNDYDDVRFTVGPQWKTYLEAASVEAWFTVKSNPRQKIATLEAEVDIIDTDRGILTLDITNDQLEFAPGMYFWQIQILDTVSDPIERRVALEGTLYLKPTFKV